MILILNTLTAGFYKDPGIPTNKYTSCMEVDVIKVFNKHTLFTFSFLFIMRINKCY